MQRIALVLAGLTLLAGCGGSSDDEGGDAEAPLATSDASETPAEVTSPTEAATPSPADDTAELRAAVTAYSDAFLTGDGEAAYDLFTARCKDRTPRAEFAGLVEQAGQLYGSALPIKTFDAQVSGDLARVTYTYDIAGINQDAEPWAREDGQWRQDDC